MAKFFAGASGWTYKNWRGKFYPRDLPAKQFLQFYAKHFHSAEVNYSFYQLPRVSTYESWFEQTPNDFVFALKLSRYITHIKRLNYVKPSWKDFVKRARRLKEKLGPILLQFPPSFKLKDENVKRVDDFLKCASKDDLRIAMEFRDKSCFEEPMLAVLRRHQAALVISHSSRFPVPEVIATGPFMYFRFHGPKEWCSSCYSKAELEEWGARIKSFMKNGLDAYAYFNNDARADAAPNAELLREIVSGQ